MSLSLAVLFAAQAQAPSAAATELVERLHVDWLAPEGCPSREALEPSLQSNVPSDHTFHASVRIDEPAEASGPWRAVVVTTADGNQHTRVVEGSDCERASKAAVLVVTLAATSLPPPEALPPAPVEAPEPPTPEVEEAAVRPQPSEPFSFRLRVQPLVGAKVGLFPLPGVSWGLALSTTIGRVRVELSAADSVGIQGPGRTVRASVLSVGLKGCWLLEPRDGVRVGPCAAVDGGRLLAEAAGVTAPQPNTVFWGSALAGVTAGYTLTKSISPWVSAELGVNLVRPQFVVTTRERDLMTVHTVGWVLGRFTLGLEFELSLP